MVESCDEASAVVAQPEAPTVARVEALRQLTPQERISVISAVTRGHLEIGEALARFSMAAEEFSAWDRAIRNFGLARGHNVGASNR